jgi:DNA uptake protein ComE-like DNA-binding protein
MENNIKNQALKLVEEALHEFEDVKGSVSAGVLKLNRAASLVDDKNIIKWCEVHLGNEIYTIPFENLIEAIDSSTRGGSQPIKEKEKEQAKVLEEMVQLDLIDRTSKIDRIIVSQNSILSLDEFRFKTREGSGGLQTVGFIEQKYKDLAKKGNDGTYYRTNIHQHLEAIRNNGHKKAKKLYKQLAFESHTKSSFEILKNAVEDNLLDLSVDLAEQITVAFKAIQSDKKEEWSQALATCRRYMEGLADVLYPPKEEPVNGRKVGKTQYINRIWAFMDENIQSESNKELAKSHLDFIGNYVVGTYKLTNKGVHAEIDRLEAIKTVFHTYLLTVDLLNYLKKDIKNSKEKLSIQTATIDEIEILLEVSRNIAKEIVKCRMQSGGNINIAILKTIKGIGKKTLDKAIEVFDLK